MSAAVSSTSSNTADQRTLASWFAPTTDFRRSVDEHAQRRRGLAPRQRRHAYVEAGRLELRARRGHQVPRFVLAQDHLAPPRSAGAEQRGQHPLEARDLVLEMRSARARVHDRLLDRQQLAAIAGREHREVPDVAVVGRIEPDDQATALARDGTAPALDACGDIAREPDRRVERAAVEAAEERFGHVGRGADVGRRRRGLELARAVATDRVDHARERGAGERARVDVLIEREQRPGHRVDQVARGAPGRRGPESSAPSTSRWSRGRVPPRRVALAQERNHRAARGELDRPDRDVPQPAHAGADAFDLTGAGRDEPTEHVADGDRLRVGLGAARKRNRTVARPARGRRAGCRQHRGQLVTGSRRRVPARGPRNHAARFPRHLHLDDTGLGVVIIAIDAAVAIARGVVAPGIARARGAGRGFGATLPGVAGPRLGQSSLLGLEVGDAPVRALRRAASARWRGALRRRGATPAARRATRPDRPAAPRVVRAWRHRRPRRRRTYRTATARWVSASFLSQISAGYDWRPQCASSKKKMRARKPVRIRQRLGADRNSKTGLLRNDSKVGGVAVNRILGQSAARNRPLWSRVGAERERASRAKAEVAGPLTCGKPPSKARLGASQRGRLPISLPGGKGENTIA